MVGHKMRLRGKNALLHKLGFVQPLYSYTFWLILIYRPSEGERLSRPRQCSQCAARAQSCVSQWFSWKHNILSAARFELGPSRASGKRATIRPMRPVKWLPLAMLKHSAWFRQYQWWKMVFPSKGVMEARIWFRRIQCWNYRNGTFSVILWSMLCSSGDVSNSDFWVYKSH